MPIYNLSNLHFTAQEKTDLTDALDVIRTILTAKSVNLTPEERKKFGSVAEKAKLRVQKVLDYHADSPHLASFRDCLRDGEPICGRLQPEKNALLYGARADEIASTALLPLPGVGLVAVGSRDGNRFYPGMGTLFLRMMGEAFAVALLRHRD